MRNKPVLYRITALVYCLSSCTVLIAQQADKTEPISKTNCSEIEALAGMTSAKSSAVLMNWKPKAGDSYRAKVVFAFSSFELHPIDADAAAAVLDLIPQNDQQDLVWHSLDGAADCLTESEKDMRTLDRLQARLPHDLATAVLLVPSKMLAYVSYANTSGADPNSDYAVQMQRVCRVKHREFVKAVDQLPPNIKKWFLSGTFNPDGCHALKFPEQ